MIISHIKCPFSLTVHLGIHFSIPNPIYVQEEPHTQFQADQRCWLMEGTNKTGCHRGDNPR